MLQNKASDTPKFKGEKDLMPASMRVKDAAEAVLTCIIDQVVSIYNVSSWGSWEKGSFLIDF